MAKRPSSSLFRRRIARFVRSPARPAGTWTASKSSSRARANLEASAQTLFHTADVELGETVGALLAEIERHDPDRVVIDSIGQIRLLSGSLLQYQGQLIALRDFFAERGATVLIADNSEAADHPLADLAHGTILFDPAACPNTAMSGAALRPPRCAASTSTAGTTISASAPAESPSFRAWSPAGSGYEAGDQVKSGRPGLNELLAGGLEASTAALIIGATGTGKTSLATLYAHAAAQRGQHAADFSFDERPETFFMRSKGLDMDVRALTDQGLMSFRSVETAELSPGEFAQLVRSAVEDEAPFTSPSRLGAPRNREDCYHESLRPAHCRGNAGSVETRQQPPGPPWPHQTRLSVGSNPGRRSVQAATPISIRPISTCGHQMTSAKPNSQGDTIRTSPSTMSMPRCAGIDTVFTAPSS